jgi:hypothetical protein
MMINIVQAKEKERPELFSREMNASVLVDKAIIDRC